MDLYPAIDLRAGRVVRLAQGEASRETRYHDDPVAQAEQFAAAGAGWIHLVDLDRAFGNGDNLAVIGDIATRLAGRVRLQVGGGLRSLEALQTVLALGASRGVVGTAAVTDPELVPAAVRAFGAGQVAVGLDSRAGRVAIRGWMETTDLDVIAVARQVLDAGVRTIISTDVGRDGMLTGPDLSGLGRLHDLGADVIASGGVASLDDLRALAGAGMAGAIVGRALYEGHFSLEAALACA